MALQLSEDVLNSSLQDIFQIPHSPHLSIFMDYILVVGILKLIKI